MDIKFEAFGMDFRANVRYTPGNGGWVRSGPAEYWDACDEEEIEFESLHANGFEADFLLDSVFEIEIVESAMDAAREQVDHMKSLAGLDDSH